MIVVFDKKPKNGDTGVFYKNLGTFDVAVTNDEWEFIDDSNTVWIFIGNQLHKYRREARMQRVV